MKHQLKRLYIGIRKHALIEGVAIFLALSVLFLWMPRAVERIIDPYILSIMTVFFGIIFIVSFIFTRRWTHRAVGVTSTILGDFFLYASFSMATIGITIWSREHLQDIARAALITAIIMLAFGIPAFVVENWEVVRYRYLAARLWLHDWRVRRFSHAAVYDETRDSGRDGLAD